MYGPPIPKNFVYGDYFFIYFIILAALKSFDGLPAIIHIDENFFEKNI